MNVPGPGASSAADLLADHISTWPGPAAVAVVGPGPAPVAAGPTEQPFAWASVTKLLVALATWVAEEEGTVSFDDPAGPPGSTLAHLLSHASGLPFEGHRPIAPPGQRRTYSNTGIEVAAEHVASAANMPFRHYLAEAVLQPLGMGSTSLEGSPAHGARGPLADLLALAQELMTPTLVSPTTLRRASAVTMPGLAGVLPGFGRHNPCDWGLGPEVRSGKRPHWTGTSNSASTFGHFGQSGSFLWVDPEAGLGMVSVSATPFGPWAKQAWPALADAVRAHVGGSGAVSWWAAGGAPAGA